ncbi:MAG: ribonuclease HI [Legionellales bacterium RIFCSPHIGHO2_12_FULL_37_14]|nr:MAG: ribonuclease HI [Legionellales bacterium RIFCSPHIGHO2_12_FULL_37_14]
MNVVEIYTDGACRGNPGDGGWGALLRYKSKEKTIFGAEPDTTNNRMELTAAIRSLQSLKRSCNVKLYTDSQYLKNGMTIWIKAWKAGKWKRKIKNVDLWQELDKLAEQHKVEWHWVKAHAGHPENERADALANHAIDTILKKKQHA